MLMKTFSALVHGIDAIPITIETDISKGLPSYQVIGHPDTSIKESKERLRLAFNYSGFSYPKGRVTINMSPADLYKRGSHFDRRRTVRQNSVGQSVNFRENNIRGSYSERRFVRGVNMIGASSDIEV